MAVVVLAMSGGVDSSVAAHLLQSSGLEVIGVFMRHGAVVNVDGDECRADASLALPILPSATDPPFHKQGCCTAEDAHDARAVAERLGIDFYALNLQADFDRIMDYFTEEYVEGRTPNPCVMCNHWVKFGRLFKYADSVGAEYVATGHYARLATDATGKMGMYRGVDAAKDQSYVLFGIHRSLLPRMLLPVGDYTKPHIRELAGELGMDVAAKKDSQEICFVSPGKHADFVAGRSGDLDTSGEIVTSDGQVVGRHTGIERFTIGQRKGLGIAFGEPRYVTRIDAASRQVTVGPKQELARQRLSANRANWLNSGAEEEEFQNGEFQCAVQIRYNSSAVPARVRITSPTTFDVEFDEPCYGVAPGQAVVCYDDQRVLGGGWIR